MQSLEQNKNKTCMEVLSRKELYPTYVLDSDATRTCGCFLRMHKQAMTKKISAFLRESPQQQPLHRFQKWVDSQSAEIPEKIFRRKRENGRAPPPPPPARLHLPPPPVAKRLFFISSCLSRVVGRAYLLAAWSLREHGHHLVKLCVFHSHLQPPVKVVEVRKLEKRRRSQESPFAVHPVHLPFFFRRLRDVKTKEGRRFSSAEGRTRGGAVVVVVVLGVAVEIDCPSCVILSSFFRRRFLSCLSYNIQRVALFIHQQKYASTMVYLYWSETAAREFCKPSRGFTLENKSLDALPAADPNVHTLL